MLVYSYDTIGGSLSLKYTGILLVTDVDRRSAGRLMASTALFKNLIFIKCFGFSAGTSLLTGLNNLKWAMSRMMAITLYLAEE